MVILRVNLSELRDAQIPDKTIFLGLPVRMFLEELAFESVHCKEDPCSPM